MGLSASAEAGGGGISRSAVHRARSRTASIARPTTEHINQLFYDRFQRQEDVLIGVVSGISDQHALVDTCYGSKHIMCLLRGGGQAPQTANTNQGGGRPLPPPLPPPPPPPLPTSLTEVYENEMYTPDDQSWSAAAAESTSSSFTRWTQPDGTPSPPPTTIAAPSGYEFADEWKIDVTGVGVSRDELGWEYSWDGNGLGRRRRRWLRKLKVRRVQVRDAADILREQREQEQGKQAKEKIAIKKKETSITDSPQPPKSKQPRIEKEKEKEMNKTNTATFVSRRDSYRASRANGRSSAQRISRAVFRPIRENWNFKGYGIVVLKSLIFPSAGGISFRLPLSINFDWYERRPELPSITSSAAYYYSNSCPWTYAIFLHASLPMELIRFYIRRFGEYSLFLVGILWSTILVLSDALWRVLVFPITVLVRFASLLSDMALDDFLPGLSGNKKRGKRKKKKSSKSKKKAKKGTVVILGQAFPRLPPPRGIVYSTIIQDRVGVSASWRISATRGYEFRISYWHLFLPTMLSMASALAKAARLVLMLQENASKSKNTMKGRVGGDLDDRDEDNEDDVQMAPVGKIDLWKRLAEPFEDWIQRKTGSLGITWGGPIPEPPYLGASAMLSLSALYPTDVSGGLQRVAGWLSPRYITDKRRRDRKEDMDESDAKKPVDDDVEVVEVEEAEDSKHESSTSKNQKKDLLDDEEDMEGSSKILARAASDGDDDDHLDGNDSGTEDAELPISTH